MPPSTASSQSGGETETLAQQLDGVMDAASSSGHKLSRKARGQAADEESAAKKTSLIAAGDLPLASLVKATRQPPRVPVATPAEPAPVRMFFCPSRDCASADIELCEPPRNMPVPSCDVCETKLRRRRKRNPSPAATAPKRSRLTDLSSMVAGNTDVDASVGITDSAPAVVTDHDPDSNVTDGALDSAKAVADWVTDFNSTLGGMKPPPSDPPDNAEDIFAPFPSLDATHLLPSCDAASIDLTDDDVESADTAIAAPDVEPPVGGVQPSTGSFYDPCRPHVFVDAMCQKLLEHVSASDLDLLRDYVASGPITTGSACTGSDNLADWLTWLGSKIGVQLVSVQFGCDIDINIRSYLVKRFPHMGIIFGDIKCAWPSNMESGYDQMMSKCSL